MAAGKYGAAVVLLWAQKNPYFLDEPRFPSPIDGVAEKTRALANQEYLPTGAKDWIIGRTEAICNAIEVCELWTAWNAGVRTGADFLHFNCRPILAGEQHGCATRGIVASRDSN